MTRKGGLPFSLAALWHGPSRGEIRPAHTMVAPSTVEKRPRFLVMRKPKQFVRGLHQFQVARTDDGGPGPDLMRTVGLIDERHLESGQ